MAKQYDLKKLSDDKFDAFKLGLDHGSIDELRALIGRTTYTNGLIAELVVAYMLGYFKTLAGGNGKLYVTMSAFADKMGVDFILSRFGWDHKIQQKFNDKRWYDVEDDVHLIRLAPSRVFKGTNLMDGEVDRGDIVLFKILTKSETYDENEVYEFLDEHAGFSTLCRDAWHIINY